MPKNTEKIVKNKGFEAFFSTQFEFLRSLRRRRPANNSNEGRDNKSPAPQYHNISYYHDSHDN